MIRTKYSTFKTRSKSILIIFYETRYTVFLWKFTGSLQGLYVNPASFRPVHPFDFCPWTMHSPNSHDVYSEKLLTPYNRPWFPTKRIRRIRVSSFPWPSLPTILRSANSTYSSDIKKTRVIFFNVSLKFSNVFWKCVVRLSRGRYYDRIPRPFYYCNFSKNLRSPCTALIEHDATLAHVYPFNFRSNPSRRD